MKKIDEKPGRERPGFLLPHSVIHTYGFLVTRTETKGVQDRTITAIAQSLVITPPDLSNTEMVKPTNIIPMLAKIIGTFISHSYCQGNIL